MPSFKNRLDKNQSEIVMALRACGWCVIPTNIMRGKMLDLCVSKQGVTIMVECKVEGEDLTNSEKVFIRDWLGLALVAYSSQEAVDRCEACLSMLRHNIGC